MSYVLHESEGAGSLRLSFLQDQFLKTPLFRLVPVPKTPVFRLIPVPKPKPRARLRLRAPFLGCA